jgi:hypothetical protein
MWAWRRMSSSRSCIETWLRRIMRRSQLPLRTMVSGEPLTKIPNRCERYASWAKSRWSNTRTTPPPIVARKGAEPLMARESTAERMMSRMASNGGLASERAFMAESDHHQRCNKNDDSAQGNLNKCQIVRFNAQTEQCFKKVQECVHRTRVYR